MTEFENLLRQSLQMRAEQTASPAATARVIAHDFRPRQRPGITRTAFGATVAAASAGLVSAAMILSGSASTAFADWRAVPTRGDAPLAALSRCGGHPTLTDTRGPYTAMLYGTSGGARTCVQGGGVSYVASVGGQSGPPDHVASGQIEMDVLRATDRAGHGFTVLDGRVGPGVAAVAVTRTAGMPVRATMSHGWYLVWWPARVHVRSTQITTGGVSRLVPLPALATVAPPRPCSGQTRCLSTVSVGVGGSGSRR
jgi:hypothetical protein